MRSRTAVGCCALLCVTAPQCALSADFSLSGFGTLGYAQSNRPYAYDRFIDDRGTFKSDSVLGLQADGKFNQAFGATLQLKASPSLSDDRKYAASISWAFLSYRPTNDVLIRLGKQRLPLYLFSESYDVGATYDFARLPAEMYTISPSNDFIGISMEKTFALGAGDLSVSGFAGETNKTPFRFWLRADPLAGQTEGASFIDEDSKLAGVSIAFQSGSDTYRLNVGQARLSRSDGRVFDTSYPFVPVAPGAGYYQVSPSLPGPGIPSTKELTFSVASLGAELAVGGGFRVISELSRVWIPASDLSAASTRGYVSLLRKTGNWTPYLTYASMRSASNVLDFYARLDGNLIPAAIPGAALLNATQRAGVDHLIVYDQHSLSMGTSYTFSAKSVVKAEFMRTRIGQGSLLVDTPADHQVQHENINVFSVSYSFVF